MYAITIFLSAFLLFQVEPLIAKYILPWFGGTPAVWTTCLLFFQVTLLAGYAYAHGMAARFSGRTQGLIHLALLTVTLLLLPIVPSEVWKPGPDDSPTWRILMLLSVTIGVPYLVLSATAPLLQHWFHRTHDGRSPFRYYALSNVGALLALATYPLVFEPLMRLSDQGRLWSWLYAAFALSCAACAVHVIRHASSSTQRSPLGAGTSDEAATDTLSNEPVPAPKTATILLWLAMAACGSVMLLATTNQMCQDVAAIPFLWVLPLSLYLISFVICFDREKWYRRSVFVWLMIVSIVLVAVTMALGSKMPLTAQIAIYSLTLWACCMCCHGELVKRKPHPSHLTLFYLMVAAGGALGGLFVAVVAPLIFTTYFEYPVGMMACCALVLLVGRLDKAKQTTGAKPRSARKMAVMGAMIAAAVIVAVWSLQAICTPAGREVVAKERNFYGTLRVTLDDPTNPRDARYTLAHGSTIHGFQFRDLPQRLEPTLYYVPESGVGLALNNHPKRSAQRPLKIGVIGLGAGTLAAYAQRGDTLCFYEINPAVVDISDRCFTFRKDAASRGADIQTLLGDARIVLERQLTAGCPQQFDVLAVDAFSSDAIPAHLLTRECFEIYWRHLRPDGILAVHISNHYLDLGPVVHKLAQLSGKKSCQVSVHTIGGEAFASSCRTGTWVLITSNDSFLASKAVVAAQTAWSAETRPAPLWTDDFYSLFGVLR